jgi:hypothetical protein
MGNAMSSTLRFQRAAWVAGVCFAVAACDPPVGMPEAGGGDAASDGPSADRSPPPPSSGNGQRCALSADCPSGTFCDLGECIQQCNLRDPCTGQFTCTPRGRCAEPEAGVASDPPVEPVAGVFAASPTSVRVETQDTFTLQLSGSGRVRYRIEALPAWLSVPSLRGEFDNMGTITVSVNRAMLMPNDLATVEIISTQGRSTITVAAPGDFTGTYRGVVNYTGVRVRAGAAPVPIDLGATRIGVQLLQDRSVLSARIDTAQSLLWPAGASGSANPGPATGLGDVQSNTARVRLVQVLDATTLRSLLNESASVFGARTVGRELQFTLQRTSEGRVEGEAVERITGLTSEPIELVGSVSFSRVPNAPTPMFVVGTNPTLPMGPARDPGPLPLNCTLPAVCLATTTIQQKRDCVGQLMATGFPLHVVHAAMEGAAFRVDSLAPPGQSSYSVASQNCVADLDEARNPTWRLDGLPPAMRGQCANFAMLQCARHQGASLFRDADPERAQVAHDVTRAWGEAFSLIGNESMVAAWKASVAASSTPASDMRTHFVAARRAYDAGLARIFDPRMLEELRAATPAVVAAAPYYANTSPGRNDRIALRRAADLLGGSLRATNEIVSLDRITSSTRPTFRDDVTRDAVLLWIESAIIADLDARWRPADQPVAEVSQLGAVLTALDRTVASLDPNNNALGVSREYVPLIARTGGMVTQTNYELLEAAATAAVGVARSSEDTARNATRTFDAQLDAIQQGQMEAELRYLGQIRDICGASFVTGTTVQRDLAQCGRDAGNTLSTQRQAAIAAQQRLAVSVAAVSAQRQRIENQRDLMVRVRNIRATDIRFQSMTCGEVDALMASNVVLHTASRALSLFTVGNILTGAFQFLTGAASVVVDTMADENNRAMARLQCAQQVRSAAAGLAEQQAREMAQLQDMLISLEQLGLQTTVDGAELARVYLEIAQTFETVKRLTSEYERVRANASRNFLNDPSFRIERDRNVVVARDNFQNARLRVYYAARGLEYETNRSLPALLTRAINAQNAAQVGEALNCVSNAWQNWQMLTQSPNRYTPEISLRRDILGITGPRTDPETGEVISAAEQFRRALMAQPYSYQGQVWPALRFSTAIREGNALFSSLVCNSRIASVEAQLVGDFLGDNNATVRVLADGAGMLRTCDSAQGAERVNAWNLRPAGLAAPATIQAGVNSFGTAGPNISLLYYPVAQSSWIVAIPTDDSANRDVDPRKIDDIILRITYTGLATGGASSMFTATCN